MRKKSLLEYHSSLYAEYKEVANEIAELYFYLINKYDLLTLKGKTFDITYIFNENNVSTPNDGKIFLVIEDNKNAYGKWSENFLFLSYYNNKSKNDLIGVIIHELTHAANSKANKFKEKNGRFGTARLNLNKFSKENPSAKYLQSVIYLCTPSEINARISQFAADLQNPNSKDRVLIDSLMSNNNGSNLLTQIINKSETLKIDAMRRLLIYFDKNKNNFNIHTFNQKINGYDPLRIISSNNLTVFGFGRKAIRDVNENGSEAYDYYYDKFLDGIYFAMQKLKKKGGKILTDFLMKHK